MAISEVAKDLEDEARRYHERGLRDRYRFLFLEKQFWSGESLILNASRVCWEEFPPEEILRDGEGNHLPLFPNLLSLFLCIFRKLIQEAEEKT